MRAASVSLSCVVPAAVVSTLLHSWELAGLTNAAPPCLSPGIHLLDAGVWAAVGLLLWQTPHRLQNLGPVLLAPRSAAGKAAAVAVHLALLGGTVVSAAAAHPVFSVAVACSAGRVAVAAVSARRTGANLHGVFAAVDLPLLLLLATALSFRLNAAIPAVEYGYSLVAVVSGTVVCFEEDPRPSTRDHYVAMVGLLVLVLGNLAMCAWSGVRRA